MFGGFCPVNLQIVGVTKRGWQATQWDGWRNIAITLMSRNQGVLLGFARSAIFQN